MDFVPVVGALLFGGLFDPDHALDRTISVALLITSVAVGVAMVKGTYGRRLAVVIAVGIVGGLAIAIAGIFASGQHPAGTDTVGVAEGTVVDVRTTGLRNQTQIVVDYDELGRQTYSRYVPATVLVGDGVVAPVVREGGVRHTERFPRRTVEQLEEDAAAAAERELPKRADVWRVLAFGLLGLPAGAVTRAVQNARQSAAGKQQTVQGQP